MISALLAHAWSILFFNHDGTGLKCSRQTRYVLLTLEALLFIVHLFVADSPDMAPAIILHLVISFVIVRLVVAPLAAGLFIVNMMMSLTQIVAALAGFHLKETMVIAVFCVPLMWFAVKLGRNPD